jgi:hypothetical protein
VGRQNSRTFWRSRVAAICPADSFVTAKGFIADSREHLMWQWLEPHDLYWRRVSSKMHSHLHTKDNQGEYFVPPSGIIYRCPLLFVMRSFVVGMQRPCGIIRFVFQALKGLVGNYSPNLLTLVSSCRLRRNHERPRRMPCARFPLQSLRRLQRHKT